MKKKGQKNLNKHTKTKAKKEKKTTRNKAEKIVRFLLVNFGCSSCPSSDFDELLSLIYDVRNYHRKCHHQQQEHSRPYASAGRLSQQA